MDGLFPLPWIFLRGTQSLKEFSYSSIDVKMLVECKKVLLIWHTMRYKKAYRLSSERQVRQSRQSLNETKFDNHCLCGKLDRLPQREVFYEPSSVSISNTKHRSYNTYWFFLYSLSRNPPAFFSLSTSLRACFSRLPVDCRFSIPRRVSVRLIGFNYGIR